MKLKTFDQKTIADKTVLVRVDFNVPLKKTEGEAARTTNQKSQTNFSVADDSRIKDSLETIRVLRQAKAKIILISHLGRPAGQVKPELSLRPVARHLSELIEQEVVFVDQTIGQKAQLAAKQLRPGQILLLENLRFHPEEKANNRTFARQLAGLAEAYINEAFAASHRAHASIKGVAQLLPAYAGLHLQTEVENLTRLMDNPDHPFVMVVGGTKLTDKVEAVKNLNRVADLVLVGGGVANSFLKAEGIETHKSFFEQEPLETARQLIEQTKTEKVLKDGYIPLPKILFPIDVVAAPNKDSQKTKLIDLTHDMQDTPNDKNLMYFDIGPKTTKLYLELLSQAKTVFWNGPLGVFEKKPFSQGTKEIAQRLAGSPARVITGGGDTIRAINKFSSIDQFDYVSSAGGAALAFLAGKKLPGLEKVS
ncbi:MAG: phosphoglycerate kinase [Candidatus Pacebacteria bacterium]|nr:phosphoglycerate kinase [Candidatus Paceibacterota bacterium]